MSFHLFYWGGVRNDGVATEFLKTDEQNFWFDTTQERQEFRSRLEELAKERDRIVCFAEHDGLAAQSRTVAVMVFKVDGKEYPLEYDFGVGYSADSADFMFKEGNYACDCNRSLFLSEQYPEIAEKDECGDEIELVSFKVEHRPIDDHQQEGGNHG